MRSALILATLVLVACDGVDTLYDCPDLYAASTWVTLTDADGDPLEETNASWRVAGEGEFEPCDENHDGTWTCGWETGGELELLVDAWGYGEVITTVTVGNDSCNVITEHVTVVLDPLDCTLEVVPSVLVTLEKSDGSPITGGATVVYNAAERDHQEDAPCEDITDAWLCGEELEGEIAVTASHPTYLKATGIVTVAQDECHVITETLVLVLAQP